MGYAASIARLAPILTDGLCLLCLSGLSLAMARSLLMAESPQLVGTAVFLDLARQQGADTFVVFEAGLLALGAYAAPVARWARLELELWCFAFLGWFSQPRVPAGAVSFSHHREAGWSGIALVLTMLVAVEGALVHLWLGSAGFVTVQWLACAAHVYALIWLLGDAHALRLRRTTLADPVGVGVFGTGAQPCLEVRVGVRARGRYALSAIAGARCGSWDSAGPGEQLLCVSGPANVRIEFHHEVQLTTALRAPSQLRALLLQVDEPALFARTLVELQKLASLREQS